MKMKEYQLAFFAVVIFGSILVLVNEFKNSFIANSTSSSPKFSVPQPPSTYDRLGLSNRFELYVRLTNIESFRKQLDGWLFKSINLFFVKYLASTVVVLDKEKSADWDFGNEILKNYKHMKLRLCFMNPVPQDIIHNWSKERMYLDMMHADNCTQKEFVGFLDVDTLFVTAVTEDLLFEDDKPVVTGRIGAPRIPCWIATAEYILGRKQVMQCMSYFPVVFKVTHITEMRTYVEKIHNKTFLEVFKIAPQAAKVATSCFCHYSIMCNFVWYHHREAYAWHLQVVPGGKWNGIGAIPSMVDASYFENEVLASEKIPIPRSSVHARHIMHKGKYLDGVVPSKAVTDTFMKEGVCYSFGFEKCPEKCREFNKGEIQNSLFAFENYRWQWDPRCYQMQVKHYTRVSELVKSFPKQFYFDVTNSSSICTLLDRLSERK
eukprot:Seg4654.1 transcript_id=Seg4654.1/GoldUCD/mRNA.D3Y31 product="hypothetical protein" protein_id=Seg4654.1/GoldUCD/D3Y31